MKENRIRRWMKVATVLVACGMIGGAVGLVEDVEDAEAPWPTVMLLLAANGTCPRPDTDSSFKFAHPTKGDSTTLQFASTGGMDNTQGAHTLDGTIYANYLHLVGGSVGDTYFAGEEGSEMAHGDRAAAAGATGGAEINNFSSQWVFKIDTTNTPSCTSYSTCGKWSFVTSSYDGDSDGIPDQAQNLACLYSMNLI